MKTMYILSGEKVIVTNEERDFDHGKQLKVIYSGGSVGWEYGEDLFD